MWHELVYDAHSTDTTDWLHVLVNTSDGKSQSPPNIIVPSLPPIECLLIFADGSPAAGASVVIQDNRLPTASDGFNWGSLWDISDMMQTDIQGRVKLQARTPTQKAVVVVKLRVGKEAYENQFPLKKSQDASGLVKIVIQPPVLLTGRILKNSQPVAGAVVVIRERQPEPYNGPEIQVATDEDGVFQKYVTPKDYDVMLQSLPNYRISWNGKRAFKLVNGVCDAGDLEVNFPLEELAGQLVGADGQPLADAKILPVPLNPDAPFVPTSSVMATTDKSGNFRFPQLPRGEYDLRITLNNGDVIESINGKLTPGRNVSVKVMIGQ